MRPNIGEFLSALRRSKGLTQQEVADRLGVSNKTVSSWETGASYPDISMLSSIAELYGVTCDEILRGERIPPAEPQERTEQRREKNLSRLLAGYRNNASAVAWICAGLYAVAVIAALLIGCVALESLIGFFVGLIFLLAGTLLCVIQYKYLRFQLTQNDFASDAVQAFLQALRRRQTGVLVSAAAAFGCILPHAFVPVRYGLSLLPALGYGLLGAAGCALLALLAVCIVRTAQRSLRADRERFFWTLKNGFLPYALFVVAACLCAALAVMVFLPPLKAAQGVTVRMAYADTYAELVALLRDENELFAGRPYTVYETDETETTVSAEELAAPIGLQNRLGSYAVGRATYRFEGSLRPYETSYRVESAGGASYVTVEVLTLTLADGGVLSFPVFNPDYQGGLEELSDEGYGLAADPVYSEEKEERCRLFVRFGSPLYEDAAAESAAVTFAAVFAGVVLFWIAAAGVYTVFYVRRRKKFRAAHAAAQQGGGGTMPDEECRM